MRYYIDHYETNEHGQVLGFTPFPFRSLGKIKNCLCTDGIRRTVSITGEPDTVWTAQTTFKKKSISGYVTCENGEYRFNATGKNRGLIPLYSCECQAQYCSCPNRYAAKAVMSLLETKKAVCLYCSERH